MEIKYHEEVYVVKIHPWDNAILKTPSEGDVSLNVKNRATNKDDTLEAFLSGHDEVGNWSKVKEGDGVFVRLALLNWQYNDEQPSNKPRKNIIKIKGYEYSLNGEIVQIGPHPSYADSLFVVIDCGVYFETRVGKNLRLKIGDYMSAEGRLDAHIVEKVN